MDSRTHGKRITNKEQVDGTQKDYIEEWLNKPGKQLFSAEVEERNVDSFISTSFFSQ